MLDREHELQVFMNVP